MFALDMNLSLSDSDLYRALEMNTILNSLELIVSSYTLL